MKASEIAHSPLPAILLIANLLATFLKVLFHEDFYDRIAHPAVVPVDCGIGFLVSVLTLITSLKYLKGGWRMTLLIGSLITGYWWLSDIVWWVKLK